MDAQADKDLPLKEDTRLLGRVLGDVLRAQTAEEGFARIEAIPTLERSIRNRFPYLDPLNHLQVELLRRYRSGQTHERTKRGIHLTINGLAAGLRNSG